MDLHSLLMPSQSDSDSDYFIANLNFTTSRNLLLHLETLVFENCVITKKNSYNDSINWVQLIIESVPERFDIRFKFRGSLFDFCKNLLLFVTICDKLLSGKVHLNIVKKESHWLILTEGYIYWRMLTIFFNCLKGSRLIMFVCIGKGLYVII